jgi:hypothetical protein
VQRPVATIKYLRCTTSGAAGIGLGTTTKYLRRSTSGAAGNGLCTAAKYLRGAAGIGLGTMMKYLHEGPHTQQLGTNSDDRPFSVAAFVVNSESHTGARSSVRLCVGP